MRVTGEALFYRVFSLCLLLSTLTATLDLVANDQYLTAYTGRYSDSALAEDILTLRELVLEDARLLVVGYGKTFAKPSQSRNWDYEVHVGKWFNEQTNYELNIAAVHRWNQPPWERWIDSSVAVCNGLSYASDIPELEERLESEGSTRLMYYLCIDSLFALPNTDRWQLQLRIHHRSTAFGLFNSIQSGANSVTLGLRYEF